MTVSTQPGARKAVAEVWSSEGKTTPRPRPTCSRPGRGTKWPKTTAKITDNLDVLRSVTSENQPRLHAIHRPQSSGMRRMILLSASAYFCALGDTVEA